MSRRIRRKPKMSKKQFKTVLIVCIIAVCLFVIYKFNFTTRSEVEITTPVKFKEYNSSNEMLANIPVLEDENGKYIVLPEKVNGIFASEYYLSESELKSKKDKNTNTNTSENTAVENTISSNIIQNNVTTNETESNINNVVNTTNTIENTTIENEVVNSAVKNEIDNENSLENQVSNTIDENKTVQDEIEIPEENILPTSAEDQIAVMQESLFDKATKNSEEYADKLEEIAENIDLPNSENNLQEEANTQEEVPQQTPEVNQEPAQADTSNNQDTVNQETSVEPTNNEEKIISEIGNEIITEKEVTLPGEKYYLSKEFEEEELMLTVKFQTVEINGEILYNQEFISDMINAIVKLTCYTPLGYHLDVKEEDVDAVQELKSDVESLANSETILAYDIKITNGEKEFQPEEYYQVATVSITKPEVVDFKSNSQSLQLLHIKESEEEINFEKVQMSNVEYDSFEFLTNEFSTYAVILYAADQGDKVIINDYESDKNYYLGKNYTDYMAGYNTGRYTDDNLAQVNINYYSYDPDVNLNNTEQIILNNCNWNFNNNPEHDTGPVQVWIEGHNEWIDGYFDWNSWTWIDGHYEWVEGHYETQTENISSKFTVTTEISNTSGSYIDINDTWSMEFTVPNNLRETFINSFNTSQTNSVNSSKNLSFSYDSNTYKLKVTAQNMNMWGIDSNAINHAVGPFELSFVLYFDGDISINSFNPTPQNFTGTKRALVGTTSNTEKHVLYSYVKCMPIEDGKVNVELIDNPFMDRPAGFGFNGWLSKDNSTNINTDKSTFVQTLQRTLTSDEIATKTVTINVYVDWKEASIVFINTSNWDSNGIIAGNDANNGLTLNTPVQTWDGINSKLKKITTTTASNRELNIIVLINGSLSNFSNGTGCAYTITSLYNGVDYRSRAQVNINSSIIADNDRQIDFIKTNNNIAYAYFDGTSTTTNYLSAGAHNFRIGRGVHSSNSDNTTISQVFGTSNRNETEKYKLVIESGYYNNIQAIRPRK